jgi:hypothetical protein
MGGAKLTLLQRWRELIDRDMGPQGFPDVLKKPSVRDWSRLREPGGAAGDQFHCALEIAFAYPDHVMAGQFIERALEIAERGLRERTTQLAQASMCYDRVAAIKCKNYCRAILFGEPINPGEFKRCGEDLLDYVRDSGEGWGVGDQSDHLKAVMLFLIAGDLKRASELIRIKRRFKWCGPWQQALQNLIEAVEKSGEQKVENAAVPSFHSFFDTIRDLTTHWPAPLQNNMLISDSVLRFEMSLLKYLYLSHPGEPIAWRKVFEQVTADDPWA